MNLSLSHQLWHIPLAHNLFSCTLVLHGPELAHSSLNVKMMESVLFPPPARPSVRLIGNGLLLTMSSGSLTGQ